MRTRITICRFHGRMKLFFGEEPVWEDMAIIQLEMDAIAKRGITQIIIEEGRCDECRGGKWR